MRPWQFSKPKTPGFGLSREFYVSILSSRPTLPAPREVLTPKGEAGSVVGLIAPVSGDTDKERLARPMERGAYAVTSMDRKTVLQLLVVSKEEAFFDPGPIVSSPLAATLPAETLSRIRGTWTLIQIRPVTHDPTVYPSLELLQSLCVRLAELTEGVVADPVARRYLLPSEVRLPQRSDPKVDAREHVTPQFRLTTTGLHAFTAGLRKFGLPELELSGLLEEDQVRAGSLLLSIAQAALLGRIPRSGDRVGEFEIREGGFDRGLWDGIDVYELLPPTAKTASEALANLP